MRFAGRFPLRFGGPDRTHDQEHQALLNALAPGWDVSEGTELWVEARVDAMVATMIWAVNRRLANQRVPLRMIDDLEDWEQVTALRPTPVDTMRERRQRLAAKLRGIANNAINDIIDTCSTALGANFEGLEAPTTANWITYWPGVNPGPPGYEFASNRAHVCIHTNKNGLAEEDFLRKRTMVIDLLDHMRPSWMTFTVGVGAGVGASHVCNVGIVNQTII